jgi:hypothetical protein
MEFKRVGGVSVVIAAVAVSVYAGQAPAPAPAAKTNAASATLAQTIMSDVRKALGGEDKLAAIKTLEIKGISRRGAQDVNLEVEIKGISRRGAQDVNLEGDMTISVEMPAKYLRKESIILGPAAIDVVEGLNGTEAWQEQKFSGNMNFGDDGGGGGGNRGGGNRGGGFPGQQPQANAAPTDPAAQAALEQAQLAARQTEVARVLLAVLMTTDRPVRYVGQATSPQATAEVLEMDVPDGNPVRILIDTKTYMPLMLSWTGVAQDPIAQLAGRIGFRGRGRGNRGGFFGGNRGNQPQAAAKVVSTDELAKPTTLRMYLSEYKAVNGIKLPHLVVRGSGDQVTEEWEIKSYKINPTLKADTFKK